MRLRLASLCVLFTATAVACSVVDDGKVERIDPPFGLDDTLPSSTALQTTTTQLATTTIPLETTSPQVNTEPVRLYFVASGQLNFVFQELPSPVALGQVVARLQAGPPEGDLGAGYRTIVPNEPDMVLVTSDGSGVARVTLRADFFDVVDVGSDQRLVIAQLVLTLTKQAGIGQVVFNLPVPLPSGTGRPAFQELTFADYESMLVDSGVPIDTDPAVASTTTNSDP